MKEDEEIISVYQLIDTIAIQTKEKIENRYKNDWQNLEKAITFIENTARHSRDLHMMVEDSVPIEGFGDEYPHDLGGHGNKFELDILEVMMSDKVIPERWAQGKEVFTDEELEIFYRHNRVQRHHQVPFLDNSNDSDITIWACDLILALNEKRSYKPAWGWGKISKHINSYYHPNRKLKSALQNALNVLYNKNDIRKER